MAKQSENLTNVCRTVKIKNILWESGQKLLSVIVAFNIELWKGDEITVSSEKKEINMKKNKLKSEYEKTTRSKKWAEE